MTTTPHFLRALDLGRDADERAVRRAYAKRLKQIDQAADPQGFQALRTAYELALQWAALQIQRDVVAGANNEPSTPAPGEATARQELGATSAVELTYATPTEGPVAQTLGNQVFAEFAELAAAVFDDEGVARKALELALADARLVNLEARTFFEWRVACLIVEGWHPGHEYLFGPACTCFNWEHEGRRLALFGQVGAALDAAISERLIFFRQPPQQFEVQRQTIRRLRNDTRPSARTLVDEMPLVELMIQRYPNWLRLVTSRSNIVKWHQWLEEIPLTQRQHVKSSGAHHVPVQAAPRSKNFLPWWSIGLALIVGVKLIGSLLEPSPRPSEMLSPSPRPPVEARLSPTIDQRSLVLPPRASLQNGTHAINEPREAVRSMSSPPSPLTAPSIAHPAKTTERMLQASNQRQGEGTGEARAAPARTLGGAADSSTHRPLSEMPPMVDLEPPPWHQTSNTLSTSTPVTTKSDEQETIGNVRFVKEDGYFVVDDVGHRTASTSATLKAGDRVLSCGSAYNVKPLRELADLRSCTTEALIKRDGETQYLYKVQRGAETTMSSVVVRY